MTIKVPQSNSLSAAYRRQNLMLDDQGGVNEIMATVNANNLINANSSQHIMLQNRGMTPPSRPDSTSCAVSPSPYAMNARPVSRNISPINARANCSSVSPNCSSPGLQNHQMRFNHGGGGGQMHGVGPNGKGLKIEIPNHAISCQRVRFSFNFISYIMERLKIFLKWTCFCWNYNAYLPK